MTTATLEGLSLVDQLQLKNVRGKLDELRHNFGLQIPQEGEQLGLISGILSDVQKVIYSEEAELAQADTPDGRGRHAGQPSLLRAVRHPALEWPRARGRL